MHRRAFLTGMAALSLAGCDRHQRHITVGSKNFTEQLVLGELLAQLLERRGKVPVERRFYLAGTYICQQVCRLPTPLSPGRRSFHPYWSPPQHPPVLLQAPGTAVPDP